jgi:sensor histidine kinase regulating citrate/malate metabolism
MQDKIVKKVKTDKSQAIYKRARKSHPVSFIVLADNAQYNRAKANANIKGVKKRGGDRRSLVGAYAAKSQGLRAREDGSGGKSPKYRRYH